MNRGNFMDIISVHYKDIKSLFRSRSSDDRKFDEDSFNDAFIKCASHFGNTVINYDDAIKYFWTAYVNTVKGEESRISKIESFDNEIHDTIDDEEPSYAKTIYNKIMTAVTEAFNEDDMNIYSLYKYHKWTKEDLEDAGYDCKNFDLRIKTIHKFVKLYSKKYLK